MQILAIIIILLVSLQ